MAAGRNAAAERALRDGAELVVFLDADCVPGPNLIRGYREAAMRHPDAVLSGPVTYLPEGFGDLAPARLAAATAPHLARPAPDPGTERRASESEYDLFWSLSFAVTARGWRTAGGFDGSFEGYGGEDTDFGRRLRQRHVPLVWVGGADAYHQYHPTTTPPVQHLDDILRNGARFASLWGQWPMTGWLEAFERDGLVERVENGWRRAGSAP
nr:galactosyltransferase-related protein [Frondihabitans sucicola]